VNRNRLFWEEWIINPIHDDKVLIRCVWGKNLGARPNNSIYVSPNGLAWEEWVIETKDDTLGHYAFRSHWGKYLRAFPGNPAGLDITTNRQQWETWKIEPKI
jgi:hypothetical protein